MFSIGPARASGLAAFLVGFAAAAANAAAPAAKSNGAASTTAAKSNGAASTTAAKSATAGTAPAVTTTTAAPAAKTAHLKAAPDAPSSDSEPPPSPEQAFGHHGQGNLRAELVTGYRMLLRYDKSPRCAPYDLTKSAADQQKFCGFGMPPQIGFALGFSLIDSFEPFVLARLGLSDEHEQTNSGKVFLVAAGARLYTMADSKLKVFFSPWLGFDFTKGPVDPENPLLKVDESSYRTDLLVHLDLGPELDVSRQVGIYLSGGLTMGLLRYLSANAELSLGVQVRAP